MREENLIHRLYSAYLNDEHNQRSVFHNCFHSSATVEWLIKQQLCKTVLDAIDIFQVLEKLQIIHHGKHVLARRQCEQFLVLFMIGSACGYGNTSA